MSAGFYFTRHALERCRERGIDPEEVLTALTSCRTRERVRRFRERRKSKGGNHETLVQASR